MALARAHRLTVSDAVFVLSLVVATAIAVALVAVCAGRVAFPL